VWGDVLIAVLFVAAVLGSSVSAVDHAATSLVGQPVTVRQWTVPPLLSGGYADPAHGAAFISKRLWVALHRLTGHQPVSLVWAGWAVVVLAHECGHLAGNVGERAAQAWGRARYSQLINLLGVHGRRADAVFGEAVRAHDSEKSVYG
jgi:hypothetical protein